MAAAGVVCTCVTLWLVGPQARLDYATRVLPTLMLLCPRLLGSLLLYGVLARGLPKADSPRDAQEPRLKTIL